MTRKDTGRKENASYYFISYYSVDTSNFFYQLIQRSGPLWKGAKKFFFFFFKAFFKAEANIYYPRRHFNQLQKLFEEQNWSHSSSVIQIPQKRSLAPGKLKTEFTSPIAKSTSPNS